MLEHRFGDSPRVVILMPAYHAGERIINTFSRIPNEYQGDVIIVDDASRDDTFARAQTLPARVYRNEKNLGYGGNMKVCFAKGVATGGDVFVELHADGQYDPAVIREAVRALRPTDGIVLGSRFQEKGDALHHGMPVIKFIANRLLTAIANVTLGTRLTEFHSGFHVYTRKFLEQVNTRANSNDHLFSFEILLQALWAGFTIGEIPITCTYGEGVTQVKFRKGVKYAVEMLWAIVRYTLAKMGRRDPVFQSPRVFPEGSRHVDGALPLEVQTKSHARDDLPSL
jgi:glycosyltransferase involved in cell wall biosynthesis